MICFSQKPGVCFDIAPKEAKPAWTAQTTDGCVTRLAGAVFSPDGTLLVGKTNDEEIGIWRCEGGILLKMVLDEDSAFEIHPVQLSHDNSKLLCLDWENDRVLLMNVVDGSTIHEIECDSTLAVARLSPDSRCIAIGTREGQLTLWNAETGEKISDFMKSDKEIRCLDFSPDNRLLISGGKDGLARLWNVETGEEIRTHEGHQGDIFWQALSRDGRFLAYFDNSEVRVINLETRSRIARIRAGAASDLRFGDDLQTISFNDFRGRLSASFQSTPSTVSICTIKTSRTPRSGLRHQQGRIPPIGNFI